MIRRAWHRLEDRLDAWFWRTSFAGVVAAYLATFWGSVGALVLAYHLIWEWR